MYDYDKVGCPAIHGKKYYFYKKSGLQQQYVLYVKDDLKSEERVFIDPNKFSKDGTVSMGATAFSKFVKLPFTYDVEREITLLMV